MTNLVEKLKSMGMDVSESFLVQSIIISLPLEFSQFQLNYITLKEKRNLQEMKAMLVQEEGRLKKMKEHFVHLTFHNEAGNRKAKPRKKDKRKNKGTMLIRDKFKRS